MQIAYQILRILADGQFKSGQQLAKICQVSRARIWQAVELLREYELDIHAVKGKGYCLVNPVELLAKERVLEHLSHEAALKISNIEVLNQTDSTNDYVLRSMPHLRPNFLCIAEGQVKGRGRRGRGWYSPLTKNIAMTYYTKLTLPVELASSLSLVVGISVAEAISELTGENEFLGIKWPNDIWYKDAKLCGILIDSQSAKDSKGALNLIIGIGLNTHKTVLDDASNQATSIEQIIGSIVSRNQLIALIMNQLVVHLSLFEKEGFKAFTRLWEKHDRLKDRSVSLKDDQSNEVIGICRGINENGALMVEDKERCKAYLNGDIQVRPYAVIG